MNRMFSGHMLIPAVTVINETAHGCRRIGPTRIVAGNGVIETQFRTSDQRLKKHLHSLHVGAQSGILQLAFQKRRHLLQILILHQQICLDYCHLFIIFSILHYVFVLSRHILEFVEGVQTDANATTTFALFDLHFFRSHCLTTHGIHQIHQHWHVQQIAHGM